MHGYRERSLPSTTRVHPRGGKAEERVGDDVVGVAVSLTQFATRSDGFERDEETAVCLGEYARPGTWRSSKALERERENESSRKGYGPLREAARQAQGARQVLRANTCSPRQECFSFPLRRYLDYVCRTPVCACTHTCYITVLELAGRISRVIDSRIIKGCR